MKKQETIDRLLNIKQEFFLLTMDSLHQNLPMEFEQIEKHLEPFSDVDQKLNALIVSLGGVDGQFAVRELNEAFLAVGRRRIVVGDQIRIGELVTEFRGYDTVNGQVMADTPMGQFNMDLVTKEGYYIGVIDNNEEFIQCFQCGTSSFLSQYIKNRFCEVCNKFHKD